MNHDKTKTWLCLQRWHEGDETALKEILELHLPWLNIQVRRRLGPFLRKKAETCDFVQDAVVQFLKYAPRFMASDKTQFRSLLLRIVENTLRDKHNWYTAQRRKIARERPLPSSTVVNLNRSLHHDRTPSQSADRHEKEAVVRLAIELLDTKDREIIVLHQWTGLTFAEIGERFAISTHAAQMRYHRAVCCLADQVTSLRRCKFPVSLEAAEK